MGERTVDELADGFEAHRASGHADHTSRRAVLLAELRGLGGEALLAGIESLRLRLERCEIRQADYDRRHGLLREALPAPALARLKEEEAARRKAKKQAKKQAKQEAEQEERARFAGRQVYCDGCSEQGVMGIGVYAEGLEIEYAEQLSQLGSNNVAECLAAVKALELCQEQERGLLGVEILSDSQLVVDWVNGAFSVKSATARRYVPRIRELLRQVGGTLTWIPGARNKADGLSRQHLLQGPGFRELARMRSGRDQYSRLRLPQLAEQVGEDVAARVRERLATLPEEDRDRLVASCLRWVLRGLTVDDAVRKVEVDHQISESVAARRRRERDREYGDDCYEE